jgi:HD-GYP domain-containing protein (c-di-GMP phosphodiesterase class II)
MPDIARLLVDDDDDRAPEAVVGRSLVVRLYGALRATRIYDPNNQAMRDQIHELLGLIEEVMDDEVLLVAMGQCFYVNGARVRADHAHIGLFGALTAEFEGRRLAGIRFYQGLNADELGRFIRLLHEHGDAERGPHLAEAAAAAGVVHAAPVPIEALQNAAGLGLEPEGEETSDGRARARQMYRQAFRGAKAAILRTARTGRPAIRRAKRVVQPIVDSIMKNEFSMVGLTAIKNHDEYTYAHSVNVGILSIAIAHTLGLPRSELASIGLAALLHDVGKLTIPSEVLAKPGRLTDEDWVLMRRHPLEGTKIISRMPGLSTLLLDALDVCLYHHRRLDGSGYPAVTEGHLPPPIARVVTTADCYDAMTTHRGYRSRPFTGYEALHTLLGQDRRFYDPAVQWALVQTVGLYPAGTLLETASGHTVLSLNNNREDLRRPECRVLARPDHSLVLEARPEIWTPMPRHESVVRVVPPEEFEAGIDRLLAA